MTPQETQRRADCFGDLVGALKDISLRDSLKLAIQSAPHGEGIALVKQLIEIENRRNAALAKAEVVS